MPIKPKPAPIPATLESLAEQIRVLTALIQGGVTVNKVKVIQRPGKNPKRGKSR